MKFVMDERIKHRLTGVVVIVSIAVIFLPAMMKKSNRHFEESVSVSLKLPAKPTPPQVAMPTKKIMFDSVSVAHVELPKHIDEPHPVLIAKAEPLSKPIAQSVLTKAETPVKSVITKVSPVKKIAAASPVTSKGAYGIQLASFGQEKNAAFLVERLRKQGYLAQYNKLNTKQGSVYKVVVGQLQQKTEAVNLQKKLAMNMQLNGFVIKTGVS